MLSVAIEGHTNRLMLSYMLLILPVYFLNHSIVHLLNHNLLYNTVPNNFTWNFQTDFLLVHTMFHLVFHRHWCNSLFTSRRIPAKHHSMHTIRTFSYTYILHIFKHIKRLSDNTLNKYFRFKFI